MTSVEMKDAQTQKKLRKPKVSHFTHQFSGLKRSQAVQVERKMVSTASQWSDGEHNQAVKKNKKLAKVSFHLKVSCNLHCIRASSFDKQLPSIVKLIPDAWPIRFYGDCTITKSRDSYVVRLFG